MFHFIVLHCKNSGPETHEIITNLISIQVELVFVCYGEKLQSMEKGYFYWKFYGIFSARKTMWTANMYCLHFTSLIFWRVENLSRLPKGIKF